MFEYVCIRCGRKQYSASNFEFLRELECIYCGHKPVEYSVETLLRLPKESIIEYYQRLMQIRSGVRGSSKLEAIIKGAKI